MHHILGVHYHAVKDQEQSSLMPLIIHQFPIIQVQDRLSLNRSRIWDLRIQRLDFLGIVLPVYQVEFVGAHLQQKLPFSICFLTDYELFLLKFKRVFLLERDRLGSRKYFAVPEVLVFV